MKRYMIVERFKPNKVNALYQRFAEKGRQLPDGVHYIDSWIDEKVEICFQLMDSQSLSLIHQWIECWDDLAEFEIIPIISSSEARSKVLGNS